MARKRRAPNTGRNTRPKASGSRKDQVFFSFVFLICDLGKESAVTEARKALTIRGPETKNIEAI